MKDQNTEIVDIHEEIDLKAEAKKQICSFVDGSIESAKQSAKGYASAFIEYKLNQVKEWIDNKLSA